MKESYMGMVLSSATIGEYDKRVVVLSRENGRFSAFARGARRPKSPLSAVTEPFCFGEFYVYRGRDSYTIEEVKAVSFFPELRSDLDCLYMGLYFCEVADYFTREGMRADAELELLYRSLLALTEKNDPAADEPSQASYVELIRRIYELRMLMIAGYAPAYQEEDQCWHDDAGPWKLSPTAGYTVGEILNRPLDKLFGFRVSDSVREELAHTIGTFFKRNTDRKFRTLDVLENTI